VVLSFAGVTPYSLISDSNERSYGDMASRLTQSDGGFRFDRLANGWWVGRFEVLERMGIPHAVTTREGPDVMEVRHNIDAVGREISGVLGLDGVAFLEQVHGGDALKCAESGRTGKGDGLVTGQSGLGVLGKSADCPIVLIAEKGGAAVGFAHASWRSTVAGIVPAVVGEMVNLGCSARNLVACICPSAGPECYEVGPEVRRAAVDGLGARAHAFFEPGPRGKDRFDLWAANADALVRAGLEPGSVHTAGLCTLCRNDVFPSYRREGESAGRFAAVIGKPGPDTARRS